MASLILNRVCSPMCGRLVRPSQGRFFSSTQTGISDPNKKMDPTRFGKAIDYIDNKAFELVEKTASIVPLWLELTIASAAVGGVGGAFYGLGKCALKSDSFADACFWAPISTVEGLAKGTLIGFGVTTVGPFWALGKGVKMIQSSLH